jgi:hypothetical protein
VGGLPLRLAGGGAAAPAGVAGLTPGGAGGAVRAEVLDQRAVAGAGRSGVVVRLSRADGVAAALPVRLSVDYSAFAGAYGGDWAGRLVLMAVPQCALTTPADPVCAPRPVVSHNDRGSRTLTADVSVPGVSGAAGVTAAGVVAPAGPQGIMLATVSGSSSTGGDFKATALKASYTWSGGGNTGDFSWSYPLRMPPALGGPAPTVGFSYSSQSVDGLSSATNNQPSWLGDGFSYDGGFIERSYNSCADDGQVGKADLCWGTDNATLSLSGHGGELIQYSTSPDLWRPVRDDGTRVERIRDTSKNNGDNDGEYWKVTTTDGTQYFFGRNQLPGWTTGNSQTNAAWTSPVFGVHSGDPCYKASVFSDSWCQQAYRWNLDYVVDPRGNAITYNYTQETNNYGRNLKATDHTPYVRGGYLDHIDIVLPCGSTT